MAELPIDPNEEIGIDFNQHDINKERREEDYKAIENLINLEEESGRLTNLNQGARPKVRTSTSKGARPKVSTNEDVVMNYDQRLSEQNRKEVKTIFPEMNGDVIIRQIGGKIQISIYGSEEWQNLKKPDGKINSFNGELKKALGPSMKNLKGEYFIKLKRIFPHMNEKDFELIDGKDQFRICLRGEKNKSWVLFKKDGELKVRIDEKLKKNLGPLAEDIVDENKIEIEANKSKIGDIDGELENKELDVDQVENLNNERSMLVEENHELEKINENIEEKMKLRDRIKAIFKKHGLTIITVTSAVITVISAIVSNLRIGLSKLAKNLGNGLKEIGKKLDAILPGMVGAIASFIFRTAGEAIGFLAKNAWLLIIAVAIYAVDQFKKKNK